MRTKEFSVAEKFFIENHKEKMSVAELATTLETTETSVEKYLNGNVPVKKANKSKVTKAGEGKVKDTGLGVNDGSVVMTESHAKATDQLLDTLIDTSKEVFDKTVYDEDTKPLYEL